MLSHECRPVMISAGIPPRSLSQHFSRQFRKPPVLQKIVCRHCKDASSQINLAPTKWPQKSRLNLASWEPLGSCLSQNPSRCPQCDKSASGGACGRLNFQSSPLFQMDGDTEDVSRGRKPWPETHVAARFDPV